MMIWCDIFVNCNWVDTRWQKYSIHLHTNNTQNNTINKFVMPLMWVPVWNFQTWLNNSSYETSYRLNITTFVKPLPYQIPFHSNWVNFWNVSNNSAIAAESKSKGKVYPVNAKKAYREIKGTASWSRILLKKLTVSRPFKKFPASYRTRRFITAFTSAHHLSLFWAISIQSMRHPTYWRSILILSSHSSMGLSSGSYPQEGTAPLVLNLGTRTS